MHMYITIGTGYCDIITETNHNMKYYTITEENKGGKQYDCYQYQ